MRPCRLNLPAGGRAGLGKSSKHRLIARFFNIHNNTGLCPALGNPRVPLISLILMILTNALTTGGCGDQRDREGGPPTMTFLMLLSVGFYQGQKTRWVRKHNPPGAPSAWGSWAGCWKIKPRSLGNELDFPAHTLAVGPFKPVLCPTCQALCAAPRLGFTPDGHRHPVLVATEPRQVVNAPRAPPRDHSVAG